MLDVSTPGHPEYGNHRSVDSLYELIAPSAEAIDTVQDWLFDHFDPESIVRETPNSDMFSVDTTIGKAEELLNCKYFDYLSDVDGQTIVSRVKLGTHYNIDSSVGQHLYFATPTHRFPYLQSRLQKSVGAGEVNPTKLRELYNLGDAKGTASNNSQGTNIQISNNTNLQTCDFLGVASFRNQYYQLSDCKDLWTKYNIDPCTVTNVPSDEPSGSHLEAQLVMFVYTPFC